MLKYLHIELHIVEAAVIPGLSLLTRVFLFTRYGEKEDLGSGFGRDVDSLSSWWGSEANSETGHATRLCTQGECFSVYLQWEMSL